MKIGFLGLGGMGAAMAANLIRAGHQVTVWNRSPAAAEPLVALGAIAAANPAQAFDVELVISMLADDNSTRAVLLESGALASAKAGLVHLSMATLSTAFVDELIQRHREQGVEFVAAPVFGRTDVAVTGKLNILVAGSEAAIAKAQPVLDVLGQKTWPLGDDPLRAVAVKIAGNFMIASAIEAMGESAALVKTYGVAASEFMEIMGNTLFNAPVYRNYGAQIAEQRFDPAGFRLVLGLKDVGLALSAGYEQRVPLPLASLLRDNLLEAIAHGDGELDWSALSQVALRKSGQL
ncbi:NAD(P)-dependent oxidoreductase [Pseudomonas sp. PDM18]|uniref:NAD(P)-dependent oxidoreductase n=1 Tax=Pseudomonas sp. PDM18 TaxID=2769253 RepID=UPI001784FAD1|nr:NAD(P)-dependent oxidoreductase [Pseudomonas sp. PDM18]MBD9675142.1 NAD(P)-dependent oxidoreductase [Pseudomonas sp. PDM18]